MNPAAFRAALVLITERYIGPVKSGYDIKNAIEDHAHDSRFDEFYSEDGPSMKDNALNSLMKADTQMARVLKDLLEEQERSTLFDLVKNPNDWRAEILAKVDPKKVDCDKLKQAIRFYTGTEASFTIISPTEVVVRAVGYRNGPCGP